MATKNTEGRINFARFGKRSRTEIEADAAAEMSAAGVTHNWTIARIHRNGVVTEIHMPKVKDIREKLGLTQAEFAKRFRLSLRTIQQWEQRRAVPDRPAILLLRAIEADPIFMTRIAAEIERPVT